MSVEGKGTKTCTPKTEGALEDLKKELDKCRCPEPQDNAGGKADGGDAGGDVEEADRETLEPACEGETRVEELAAVEEFCEVELKSSDWDCVDVPAPIPQRP